MYVHLYEIKHVQIKMHFFTSATMFVNHYIIHVIQQLLENASFLNQNHPQIILFISSYTDKVHVHKSLTLLLKSLTQSLCYNKKTTYSHTV